MRAGTGLNSPELNWAWGMLPRDQSSDDSSSDDATAERSDGSGSGRGGTGPRRIDGRFDRWLNRQLHTEYDRVLDEQIPNDLLALLEQFKTRDEGDDSSGASS